MGRSISEKHLGPWGEVQGTPKGALPHPGTQSTYRTPTQPGQLQHNRQGGPGHDKIKESIFIRVNNPTLNRNIGKFQLSHTWDRVLFSTPSIKVAIPLGLMKSIVMDESLFMLNQSSVFENLLKSIRTVNG